MNIHKHLFANSKYLYLQMDVAVLFTANVDIGLAKSENSRIFVCPRDLVSGCSVLPVLEMNYMGHCLLHAFIVLLPHALQ